MAKRGRKPKDVPAEEKGYLPGLAPEKNPKIHNKAMAYARLRDARIAAGAEEKQAHETLLHAMLEEGVEDYAYGNLIVHVDDTKKVKVKKKDEPSKNGDGAEEGKDE